MIQYLSFGIATTNASHFTAILNTLPIIPKDFIFQCMAIVCIVIFKKFVGCKHVGAFVPHITGCLFFPDMDLAEICGTFSSHAV